MGKKVLKWTALGVCAIGCTRIGIEYGWRGFLLYGALASAFAIWIELARQDENERFLATLCDLMNDEDGEGKDE